MKTTAFVLAAALSAGSVALSAAAPAGPAAAIKLRQANYKKLGGAFKHIMDQLKRPAPDKAVIRRNADELAALAQHVNAWFPRGSGPEAGVKTEAKAEIWEKPDEFGKDAQALAVASTNLAKAAAAGDMTAIKADVQATGKTCGACHKVFKEKDKD